MATERAKEHAREHARERFKKAGFVYFVAVSVIVIFVAAFGHSRIHYPIFIEATRHIVRAEPAYGFGYDPQAYYPSLWLYSPSCALFLFSLFAWLPMWLGKWLYLTLSLGAFLSGLLALAQALGRRAQLTECSLFWVLLSFEAVGSLSTFKLEVLTAGLALWAARALWSGRVGWAGLALAMITNWKLQGLPIAGLLIVAHAALTRTWRLPLWYLTWLLIYSALPFAFLPRGYLMTAHAAWAASLKDSVEQTWGTYQHIYVTLARAGLTLSLRNIQAVSALLGSALAALLWRHARTWRASQGRLHPYALAAALGCAYITVFSPMSQSLAFILWGPLLAAGFFERSRSNARREWLWLLIGCTVLTSIGYSDLVPRSVLGVFRSLNLKPLGPLALSVAVLRAELRAGAPGRATAIQSASSCER